MHKMPRSPLTVLPNHLGLITSTDKRSRESFDDIYLNLSKKSGKCRFAESGLGWKPSNGETFTLDKAEYVSAQWSKAARGWEIKIYTRNSGVLLLDGFKSEVSSLVTKW